MGAIGGFIGASPSNFEDMYKLSRTNGEALKTFENSDVTLFLTYSKHEAHCLESKEDFVIAFVGEIYDESFNPELFYSNFIKPRFSKPITGLFSFMVNRKNLITFRCGDLGFYPLYYMHTGNGVIFASTIQAILITLEKPISLNPLSLQKYLLYGHVPGIQTLFKGIQKVSPSSSITINLNSKSKQIINYSPQKEERLSPLSDVHEEVFSALNHSVSTVLKHYSPPYGILLSGGLDSSILAALVRRNTEEKIIAYTVSSDIDKSGDLAAAEEVADYLNIEHEVRTLDPDTILLTMETIAKTLDELSCQIHEALPKFLLMQEASKKVKLLLTGDCCDTSFFGFEANYHCAQVLKLMDKIPNRIKQSGLSLVKNLLSMMKNSYPYNREDPGYHAEFITYIISLKRLLASSLSRDQNHLIKSYFHLLADEDENYLQLYIEPISSLNYIENELSFQQPHFSDVLTDLYAARNKEYRYIISRKSMSQSLDIAFRQPFKIDTRLQEIARNLPTQLKQPRSQDTKHILRVIASKYHILPQNIIQRPKSPFFPFPMSNWLHKEFQSGNKHLLQILKTFHEIPYLNDTYLMKRIRQGNGRLLAKLLLLSLWYFNHKKFIQ
jgi:asparagine synthase (glutamine-hydrolysing)